MIILPSSLHTRLMLTYASESLRVCRSREELIRSADTLAEGLRSGALTAGDVTPALVDRCLRTQVRGHAHTRSVAGAQLCIHKQSQHA